MSRKLRFLCPIAHPGQPVGQMQMKWDSTIGRVKVPTTWRQTGINAMVLGSTSHRCYGPYLGVKIKNVINIEQHKNIYYDILNHEMSLIGKHKQGPLHCILGNMAHLNYTPGGRGRPPIDADRIAQVRSQFKGLINFFDIDTFNYWGNTKRLRFIPTLANFFGANRYVIHINAIEQYPRAIKYNKPEEVHKYIKEIVKDIDGVFEVFDTKDYTTHSVTNNQTRMRSVILTVKRD